MRRLVAFVALLVGALPFSVAQQMVEVPVNNGYFSGSVSCVLMPNPTAVTNGNGGTAMNMIPVQYQLIRNPDPAGNQPGFTTSISFVQTHSYIIQVNQFVAVTERTIADMSPSIVSKLPASNNGTNGVEMFAGGRFFKAFGGAPYNTEEYMYGKYAMVIKISVSSGPFTELIRFPFLISPIGLRDLKYDWGGDPAKGGITPGDLNDQPINKEGFWEGIFSGLFIPNEDTLETFRDTLALWGSWGPFGIINYLNTRINAYNSEDQLDYSFSVTLPYAGPTVFDLSPYETFIKIARIIQAMTLWVLVVLGMWKKVYAKV